MIGQKAPAVGFAIVDGDRSTTWTVGTRARDLRQPFDIATQFEIGSISKVFAGVLLAESVVREEVALADAVSRYLPPDLRSVGNVDRSITLLDLGSQAVSFPLMPTNWSERNPGSGKTEYTRALLAQYLMTFKHSFPPGEGYRYSNISTALVAHALELRLGKPYRVLLEERVFAPLGMEASGYGDTPPESDNVLAGHDGNGNVRLPRIDGSPLGPCCIVRTNVGDALKFVAAASGRPSPLRRAFELLAQPRRRIDPGGSRWSTLGWVAYPRQGILWKSGYVEGQVSAMVVLPTERRALFLIANREGANVDAVAAELVARVFRPQPRVDPARHAEFVVAAPDTAMTPATAVFGNAIRLEGWVAPARVKRGEAVRIRLFLRVLEEPDRDWQVFVHGDALGSQAERLGADHFPGRSNDSTMFWRKGELIIDEFELTIPVNYAANSIDVWFGFYNWHQRMRVVTSDREVRDDRVKGPQIAIELARRRR